MGVLDRLILRDDLWGRMLQRIIGEDRTRGSSGRDNRMFVEAVLWIVRTGSPWRDLPDVFAGWNSVFHRFSRWSHKGNWPRFLAMCQAFLPGVDLARAEPYKIINLRSVGGGIAAIPGFRISDGMSKAAIALVTRALAAEHAAENVDVFAVYPGASNTRMLQASTLNRMTADE